MHFSIGFFFILFLPHFFSLLAVRISLLLLTLVFKVLTDPGLHKMQRSSLVCAVVLPLLDLFMHALRAYDSFSPLPGDR